MAVAILALGSGANTAIFTVVNAMLLRPLPFRDPGQLVYLTEVNRQKGLEGGWVAPGNYLEWRDRSHLMQDIGAFVSSRTILTGAGEPVRLDAVGATASLLSTLGIQPIIGRMFGAAEDQPGKDTVVLISEGLWRSRFGARSDILGQPIVLDGKPREVIGVLPSTVRLDLSTWDIWAPLALGPGARNSHNGFYLYAIGRMKPGVDLEHARAELRAVGNSIYRENSSQGMAGWEVVTERLSDRLVRRTRPQLLLLSVAVALLLLVACANVASLLLTRSAQRSHEITIRTALGAGRRRIVRQLLTENLALSLLAGAAGLLLAHWTVRGLYGWLPDHLQSGVVPAVDLRVLAFTLLVSAGTGLLFGLTPALRASRFDLRTTTPRPGRLGDLLVVSEAAIAVVLLVGAGLLVRSFANLMTVDMGFRPERVLTVQVPLSSKKYNDRAKVAFYERALEHVRALPGVRSAAAAEVLPIEGKGASIEFAVEGRPWNGSGAFVGNRIVTPGYFETMGIPLLEGRTLDAHDDRNAPDVAVINETMAFTCWPGENPVGKRFRQNPRGNSPWITVVGVVHDVKHFGLEGKKWPEAYYPQRQTGWPSMRLIVRTAADPLGLLPAVRDVIRGIDPAVPVAEVRSMEQVVADSVAPRKLSMVLVVAFAAMALALASIGLYGMIAYSVTQRRHELGVRMALGAGRGDVLRMVGASGLLFTLVGLAAGVGASLAATRFLSDILFGVTPIDPLTYASAVTVLFIAASAAVYIPAQRATRVDPMEALRYE
jgi:putative ABC transport system permease protein